MPKQATAQVIQFPTRTGESGYTYHVTTTASAMRTFNPAPPHKDTAGPPPPTGGHDVDIATLKQRLNGAFVWLGMLTIGCGAGFLFLIGQVQGVSRDVAQVKADVAAQSAKIGGLEIGVDRILDKLDNENVQPQTSSRKR